MNQGTHNRKAGFVRLLAVYALLAMLVRAFVPAGYMAGPGEDGRFFAVTLCSGHGPVQSYLDIATGELVELPATPADAAQSNAPCVFAALAAFTAPDLPAQLAERPDFSATGYVSDPARALSGAARLAPWSTGPPATA